MCNMYAEQMAGRVLPDVVGTASLAEWCWIQSKIWGEDNVEVVDPITLYTGETEEGKLELLAGVTGGTWDSRVSGTASPEEFGSLVYARVQLERRVR